MVSNDAREQGQIALILGMQKWPNQPERIKPACVSDHSKTSQTDSTTASIAGGLYQSKKALRQIDLSSTELLPPGTQQQSNSRIDWQDVHSTLTTRSRVEQKNRDNPDNQVGQVLLCPALATLV